jgi:uncharacterized membrane protein
MKLILAFFAEGAVRAWSDHGLSARLALAETLLALVFFSGCVLYVRSRAVRCAQSLTRRRIDAAIRNSAILSVRTA